MLLNFLLENLKTTPPKFF